MLVYALPSDASKLGKVSYHYEALCHLGYLDKVSKTLQNYLNLSYFFDKYHSFFHEGENDLLRRTNNSKLTAITLFPGKGPNSFYKQNY